MKIFVNRSIVLGLILSSLTVGAMAKTIKRQVTFYESVKINETTIKAGTYDAVFDDETGRLAIFKGKHRLAEAPARLEKLNKDSRESYSLWSEENSKSAKELMRLTLKDRNQIQVLNVGEVNTAMAQ